MRNVGRLVLATLVRGVVFLVPVVLVAVLAREGYGILQRLSQPIARLLPADRVLGLLAEDLISLVAILGIFLVAGVVVGTRAGQSLSDRMERTVLYRVPGYLMVRGAVGSFPGLSSGTPLQPALVRTDDGWVFALVVERLPEGFCTVFLPDSPTPTSGTVLIVEASRVHRLEVSMLSMLSCLTRSGDGAGALSGRILAEAAGKSRDQALVAGREA